MIERASPNHDARPARPAGAAIDMLILHYTGMPDTDGALARLCDPAAKVSAHYLIDEDGTSYRIISEERRAWHAGVARWAGAADVNGRSIGVELANPGHEWGYRPFAEAQMAALVDLARDILARHPIPPRHVLGHADVAPSRRMDPGELFDWRRLAAAGIGLWPRAELAPAAEYGAGELQRKLARFGYALAPSGTHDAETTAVVTAFQRHFRQDHIDGVADADTRARLDDLIRQISL